RSVADRHRPARLFTPDVPTRRDEVTPGMRITCPHCQRAVALPDAAGGQPTPCPLCGNIFTPASLAGAALDLRAAPAINPAPAPSAAPPASRPVATAA